MDLDTEVTVTSEKDDQDDSDRGLKRQRMSGQTSNTKPNQPNTNTGNANYGSLLGKLWDPDFADVTVQVGGCAQEYKLHRTILCSESPFFKAACKSNFQEGINRLIKLPTIKPQVFEKILVWLYTGVYELPADGNHATIASLYSAADFLGTLKLKQAVLEKIAYSLDRDINLCLKKELELSKMEIRRPHYLLIPMARDSNVSEFEMFQPVMEVLVRYYRFEDSNLKNEAVREENNNLFWAALVESYCKFLHANFCSWCKSELKFTLESGDCCKICSRVMKK
ncbi:hypothetical protein AA313_de0204206 [Arthrobotrys entomopaga]|nr:hypothetical protein AA313_de0204206 [Arthrobotrys entomopaga]